MEFGPPAETSPLSCITYLLADRSGDASAEAAGAANRHRRIGALELRRRDKRHPETDTTRSERVDTSSRLYIDFGSLLRIPHPSMRQILFRERTEVASRQRLRHIVKPSISDTLTGLASRIHIIIEHGNLACGSTHFSFQRFEVDSEPLILRHAIYRIVPHSFEQASRTIDNLVDLATHRRLQRRRARIIQLSSNTSQCGSSRIVDSTSSRREQDFLTKT